MARRRRWKFSPSETRDLGVSMDSELDSDATMAGETPTVSAWTRTGNPSAGYTYSAASGFTFASQQVNTAQITADDGETVAIGRGLLARVTAPTTQGTYYLRWECDADDGTHVVREDTLIVEGAGAPS